MVLDYFLLSFLLIPLNKETLDAKGLSTSVLIKALSKSNSYILFQHTKNFNLHVF